MALTDLQVKKVKATDKPQKLSDGGGLYLLVQPNGAKYWRLKYRFVGGRKGSGSGGISRHKPVGCTRTTRDGAQAAGEWCTDPGDIKKAQKAASVALTENSFEIVAREWFMKHAPNWAGTHSSKVIRRLEADAFPWIGARPIGEITAPELLAML